VIGCRLHRVTHDEANGRIGRDPPARQPGTDPNRRSGTHPSARSRPRLFGNDRGEQIVDEREDLRRRSEADR